MSNPLMSDKVRVKIYGKEYEIDPGGLTPLEASQLADYVDGKMREIADKLRLVDTQKIAVLAALNIALDLTQQKGSKAEMGEQEEIRVQGMVQMLEKALAKDRVPERSAPQAEEKTPAKKIPRRAEGELF